MSELDDLKRNYDSAVKDLGRFGCAGAGAAMGTNVELRCGEAWVRWYEARVKGEPGVMKPKEKYVIGRRYKSVR